MNFSLEEGILAVKEARKVTEAQINGDILQPDVPASFDEKGGMFVTLNEHPGGILRACIGFPLAVYPRRDALRQSARGVCVDPRFPPLKMSQAQRCVFTVSFLTSPEKIEYETLEELKSKIEIGKDGLIVKYRTCNAVYLPEVPVEEGWNVEQYLSSLCMKAGMQGDGWRSGALEFSKFQSIAFKETSPNGEIVRV
ncbi:MAG: TIGR00296 family protein [archaeon]|nr:TIGR00296 family protein [archaeon]